MPRESNIPLFLWIATALVAHLAWGGGVTRMSRMLEETLDIKRFAASVQRHVRATGQVEIALLEDDATDEPKPEEQREDQPKPDSEDPEQADDPSTEQAPSKTEQEKKAELAKPEPEAPKPPPKLELEAEKKKEEEKKAEAPASLPKLDPKKRIAVVQHVEDKNQKDNPNADLIADEANTVKQQTQARITSADQNDPNPTPGRNHSGPTKNPGNSDESRVAHSEESPGTPDQAPSGGEPPQKVASVQTPPPAPAAAPEKRVQGHEQGDPKSAQASSQAAQKGQTAQQPRNATEAQPDTLSSEHGAAGVTPEQLAQAGQKARRARKKRLPPMKGTGRPGELLGLGALGTTQSGVTLNLTPQQAYAAIGRDRLVQERKRDVERKRSAHLGSWKSVGIEKWRAAIENYVPSVRPGNQTALNTARVPFASYLNAIHNRLHPIFADSFLASLDSLPGGHPMNKPEIKTHLEIVLSQDDGRVVRMGITHTSGVTAFDIAALESVQRASPYGAPPREIVSPDGNVYFHWEFYRNPYYARSTYFARPFLLKSSPKSAPPKLEPPPTRPFDRKEGPPAGAGERHGRQAAPSVSLEKRASLR